MDARQVYRALSGLFCIYKPAGQTMKQIVNSIKVNLLRDLNKMKCRPVRQNVVFTEEHSESSGLPAVSTINDLADHPLVIGDRYIADDIKLRYVDGLDTDASGIVVMGIGRHRHLLPSISERRYLRAYHVDGELGTATQDCKMTGNIIEKTTYFHVTHGKIDKVIAGMQAGHQKLMYSAAEVDPQSDEAYTLAVKGLLRPKTTNTAPVVYGIRCVEFDPPNFTLEIHTINENGSYLRWLINELGLEARASAACTRVRRLRYGHVNLQHALLHRHWNVEGVLHNIGVCKEHLDCEEVVPQLEAQQSTLERQLAAGVHPIGRLSAT